MAHFERPGSSDASAVVIAFVDLVQFTALTDVHGDLAAADAASALSDLAAHVSGPRLRVVKSIGDGVLLEATTRADGLAAVVSVMEGVHEHGFEARAGVDFGPVVRRDDDVFGRTVNLASRLASIAEPGRVVMTRAMAFEASSAGLSAMPLGFVEIKGLRKPVEAFSTNPCSHDGRWVIDPVCGMRVDADGAIAARDADGREAGFCSRTCADLFAGDGHGPTDGDQPLVK